MKNDLPEILALEGLLREQRAAYLRSPYPSWEQRAAHRKALREVRLQPLANRSNTWFSSP